MHTYNYLELFLYFVVDESSRNMCQQQLLSNRQQATPPADSKEKEAK